MSDAMARKVKDAEGITWSCEQAFAGLSDERASEAAARRVADGDGIAVVCTPSGGAQSVRVTLPEDWETALEEDALLREIHAAQAASGENPSVTAG